MKISTTDAKLIAQLFSNARQPFTQLGKACQISKESAAYRVASLQKKGIITGFSAIYDTHTTGRQTYRLLLSGNVEYNLEGLDQLGELAWVARLAGGKWSLTISYYCESQLAFYQLLPLIFEHITGVEHYAIDAVLSVEFYFPKLLAKSSVFYSTGRQGSTTLSENETKVLTHLVRDARIPVANLCQKIELSATGTTYLIKKLQKDNIIVGYIPLVDYTILGFEHYKIMLQLKNPKQRAQCIEIIKQQSGLVYITKVIGGHDVECELIAEKYHHVVACIDAINKITPLQVYEIILTQEILYHNEGV